ncbi:uncharacterized protein LOC131940480 [Physella acuta]|uniref:uncharacterized protein LOC131940480 n=1 Tax=Physella acuta TaxID=109671 RepID=UPI0027DB15AA|nr:uncharacterized protein LOC131940480 [Physella acuta]
MERPSPEKDYCISLTDALAEFQIAGQDIEQGNQNLDQAASHSGTTTSLGAESINQGAYSNILQPKSSSEDISVKDLPTSADFSDLPDSFFKPGTSRVDTHRRYRGDRLSGFPEDTLHRQTGDASKKLDDTLGLDLASLHPIKHGVDSFNPVQVKVEDTDWSRLRGLDLGGPLDLSGLSDVSDDDTSGFGLGDLKFGKDIHAESSMAYCTDRRPSFGERSFSDPFGRMSDLADIQPMEISEELQLELSRLHGIPSSAPRKDLLPLSISDANVIRASDMSRKAKPTGQPMFYPVTPSAYRLQKKTRSRIRSLGLESSPGRRSQDRRIKNIAASSAVEASHGRSPRLENPVDVGISKSGISKKSPEVSEFRDVYSPDKERLAFPDVRSDSAVSPESSRGSRDKDEAVVESTSHDEDVDFDSDTSPGFGASVSFFVMSVQSSV